MAHTEAPWRIGNLESYDAYTGKPFRNVWAGEDPGVCIARAIDNGDVDANAAIIAAAPALLAAAERMFAAMETAIHHCIWERGIDLVEAEIAHDQLLTAIQTAKGA